MATSTRKRFEPDNIKVLYDISVLGYGHNFHSGSARAGIYRVVENLAHQLALSDECDLMFCATESIEQLTNSKSYLASQAAIQDVPFPHRAQSNVHDALFKFESELSRTLHHHRLPQLTVFSLKVYRKLLQYLRRSLFLSPPPLISPVALSDANIFHSTYYPITAELRQARDVQKFLTIYDLIPVLYPEWFQFDGEHLVKKALRSLTPDDWIVTISQATKNDLCSYLADFDPSRVFVTHLAASDHFYPCLSTESVRGVKERYGIPDAPYILSVGTLEPRKNIDHTIRSFAKLLQQERINDLYLVLVGATGWFYDKIFEELSNQESLQDRVIVTGYVYDSDLAALYSGSIAFVYPSFYEGFGLPPLEAMQCGVPVITSNTSSLPEVVGDAGFMVSPTEIDELCQSMLKLYQDSSLRDEMSSKSLKQASKFSWAKCARETIDAYRTALHS